MASSTASVAACGGARVALAGQLRDERGEQPAPGRRVEVGAAQQPRQRRHHPLVDRPVRPGGPRRRLGPGRERLDEQIVAAGRVGEVDGPVPGGPCRRDRTGPYLGAEQATEEIDPLGGPVARPGGDPLVAVQGLGQQGDGVSCA